MDGYPRVVHLHDTFGERFPGCGILSQKTVPLGGEETAFEYLKSAEQRLKIVVPFTLLIIFVLIYMNTKSITKTMIVLLNLNIGWSF